MMNPPLQAQRLFKVAFVLFCFIASHVVSGAQWYNYRMMRNPGLVSVSATNQFDCVAQCQSTTGCSAISWNPSMQTCLKSMCNNLDLFRTTGWNTYVITNAYVECASMPAADLEWMLTDTCGNSSQGTLNGPKMNLVNTTYANPLSVYSGQSVVLTGDLLSYAMTDASSAVSFPMGNQSLTLMFWVRFSQFLQWGSSIVAFQPTLSTPTVVFWFQSGMYADSQAQGASGYVVSDKYIYRYTASLNVWYHWAFVYDGSTNVMAAYLNYSLVGVQQYRYANPLNNWQYIRIGKCSDCTANNNLAGSISCLKLLSVALNSQQVKAYGDSCMVGKVRLTQ